MNADVENKQGLAAANGLVFEVPRLVLMYLHKAKAITINVEALANAYKEKFTTQLCMFGFRDNTDRTNLPTYSDFTSEHVDLSAMT